MAKNNAVSASARIAAAHETIAAAIQAAHDEIGALRDELSELAAEAEHVRDLPLEPAAAAERLRARIAHHAAAHPLPPDHRLQANAGLFASLDRMKPSALLAHLAPDALVSALMASHPGTGIADADRRRRLAGLDRQTLVLACREELALRALSRATGSEALRRHDVDVRLVRAPDAELERAAAGPYPSEAPEA